MILNSVTFNEQQNKFSYTRSLSKSCGKTVGIKLIAAEIIDISAEVVEISSI